MLRLYTHPECLRHQPGAGHPEAPQRLTAVFEALQCEPWAALPRVHAAPATTAALARVHDAAHIARVLALAERADAEHRLLALDADTRLGPGSGSAALHAAGAGIAAVDAVLRGQCTRAFCAVRPPGHHATPGEAMGFCLFDNVAIAAAHALHAHGLVRVAIADFDVHHGNGTQDWALGEPRVCFASSQQHPLYPGSGAGDPPAAPHIHNAALAPGSGSAAFRAVWDDSLLPALDAFAPQLLLVSAGFDAHRLDPLADLRLDDADYAWIGARLRALADAHCGGRMVSLLEGGYSASALAGAVPAYLDAQRD